MMLVRTLEEPSLAEPTLLEGLPGMGFVANIAVLHMIEQLRARKFAEILIPSQPAAKILEGHLQIPTVEMYHCHTAEGRDLILLYGNTQPPDAPSQYGLCSMVLNTARSLGCGFMICVGGVRRQRRGREVYCAATDAESLNKALGFGVKRIGGRIFGSTGILLGLARLWGIRGICLLAETATPDRPDVEAAKAVLRVIGAMLRTRIDLSGVEDVVETVRRRAIFG